jgi:GSH-dependent disulfide-bond oxidoreductase
VWIAKEIVMTDLSAFPITRRWPAQHPDRLQLYSLPTPNGVKVSIMLEECGLPYEVHRVSFETGTTSSRPSSCRSTRTTRSRPSSTRTARRQPLALWESGAILIYLAEKTGQLLPPDPARV